MPEPDTEQVVAALREQTRRIRRRRFRKSRLDRHATQLLEYHRAGSRAAELQRWLRDIKHIKVALSTVTRWLARHRNG